MLNLALMLLSMNAAQARDVKHYIAVCGNGDVLEACTQPFCDDSSAYYKAREVCADRKGASDLVTLRGPRNAREALVSDVEKAIALKQRKERAERLARAKAEAKAEEDRLREEARKAEERRLQEEARKAEEARRVAAAREAAKEKDLADCLAKMTYAYTLWACPFGEYAVSPSECEPDANTPTEKYAVEVDMGVHTLPPGETCSGAYARVSDSEFKADLLKTVNEVLGGGARRPAFLVVDLESPVKQAYANWRKAEDRRLAAIPYDCLAGVCLNAPATRIADKLVTVSEVVMHRTVEVCSGRVVSVEVYAGWVLPTFEFATIAGGAEFETDGDGMEIYSTAHAEQISKELEVMGWVLFTESDYPGYYSQKAYEIPTKRGWRNIMRIQGEDHYSWRVDLKTVHPDKDALCAPKRQQGL